MNITFEPFNESHFPLMLIWLECPHVKKWWDQDITYTLDLVQKKYGNYVKGYQSINGINEPINAYIICIAQKAIGYIQTYNAYDFHREETLTDLPKSLGTFDLFIGEQEYLGKGIGSTVVKKFTQSHVLNIYQYAFVDPDFHNEQAIYAYEKAGFIIFKRRNKSFWMIAHKPVVRLSIKNRIALEVAFRKNFLSVDHLWVFGSRTDLHRKGGDLDLYIETGATTIDQAFEMKLKFLSSITKAMGEQKIDVVLNLLNFQHALPIHRVARKEGIKIL